VSNVPVFNILRYARYLLFRATDSSYVGVFCVWETHDNGTGSSVGIATDYGLDGSRIESRWGEIFRCPDWPWGPPSLLYNGYRVFPGGKVRLGRPADHSPLLVQRSRKGRAIHLPTLEAI
jgi:hypothetical protein